MKSLTRFTIRDIINKKRKKRKIAMLTAYDYPFASILDRAGIDIILVGDSLANVVLGLESTREVGMAQMIHHAKAVNRAVKNALLVGDLPFGSYKTKSLAVKNAKRFVTEAGCNAVKLEWFERCPEAAQAIIKAGIPVMGHVGLTPQTFKRRQDFKVQGTEADSAKRIMAAAELLEKKGCFSIVLECIPDKIAEMITRQLKIPTIGIGAGIHCDGQVLVTHDLLGLFDRFRPKFVKQYAHLALNVEEAVRKYRAEVMTGQFPGEEYRYAMRPSEIEKLR